MQKNSLYPTIIIIICFASLFFMLKKPDRTKAVAILEKNAVIFTEQDSLKQAELDKKVSNFLEHYYTTKDNGHLINSNPNFSITCSAKTIGYLPRTRKLINFSILEKLSPNSLFLDRSGYSGNIFAFHMCGMRNNEYPENEINIFTELDNYLATPISLYYTGDIASSYSILEKRETNSRRLFQTCEDFMSRYTKGGYPNYCDTYFPPPFYNTMKQGLGEAEIQELTNVLNKKNLSKPF